MVMVPRRAKSGFFLSFLLAGLATIDGRRPEMTCFSCFKPHQAVDDDEQEGERAQAVAPLPSANSTKRLGSRRSSSTKAGGNWTTSQQPSARPSNITSCSARAFTYDQLAAATGNFRADCLLGEGGFGRVYRGRLDDGQLVAVKQLDLEGVQGDREFVVEVLMLMLSLLHHDNLVSLVGYCSHGHQRLLVYEYMALGSLADHLLLLDHRPNGDATPRAPRALSWETRMRVALGAARGLEYLHETANPAVIYRDLKSSNVLLDDAFCPKLSDFGLARLLGPSNAPGPGERSPRVMGTYGYCAPEYIRTGRLSVKSDVYSFGVLLLELITGRRAVDSARPASEQVLVTWGAPMFKDSKRYRELADPLLRGEFPERDLNQAVAVAAMCLQDQASARPCMSDAAVTLSFLAEAAAAAATAAQPLPLPPRAAEESLREEA